MADGIRWHPPRTPPITSPPILLSPHGVGVGANPRAHHHHSRPPLSPAGTSLPAAMSDEDKAGQQRELSETKEEKKEESIDSLCEHSIRNAYAMFDYALVCALLRTTLRIVSFRKNAHAREGGIARGRQACVRRVRRREGGGGGVRTGGRMRAGLYWGANERRL